MPRWPVREGPAPGPVICQDGLAYVTEYPPPERFQAGSLSRPVTVPSAERLMTGAVPPTATTHWEAAGYSGVIVPVQPLPETPALSPDAARTVWPESVAALSAVSYAA